jgi:hypothetical protein
VKFVTLTVFLLTGVCDSLPTLWGYAWVSPTVWWWRPLIISMLAACIGIAVAGLIFPYSAHISRTIALWSGVFLEILLIWSFMGNWRPNDDLWGGRFPLVYLPLAMTSLSLLVAAKR